MRPYGGFSSGRPWGVAFALTPLVVAWSVAVDRAAGAAGVASAPTFSPGPET